MDTSEGRARLTWFRTREGKLYIVADLSGAVMRALFPVAWGMALPLMGRLAIGLWAAVGVLYVVHFVALSSATRRRTSSDQRIVVTRTVNGVTLNVEDAQQIDTIIENARQRGPHPIQ